MKRMLMCFALFTITLAAQAQMNDKQGVAKAIAGMEQQWADGSKAGDAAIVAPLLADSFINMDSDGTMSDKTKTLARMGKAKWEVNQISDVQVAVMGNTAIATGTWQGKGTGADGKAVDAHEHWVDTWMKTSGWKWQCVASASAPVKM